MKYFTLVCFLSILSLTSFAQTKDETAVAAAVEKLKKAMIDGDRASLNAVASEKLSYGHSGGHVEGREEFVEKIASGKSDFVTIDLSEQTITVSGNVAVVRHLLNATTNDNNTPGTVKLKVLLVWHKEKGGWRMLARQAVKTT
jgi:ketosteroid isomerase-like protein